RPPGPGCAHPPDVARDGGRGSRDRPSRRRAADAAGEDVMQPFQQLDGVAVALRRDNVDTDQVIPARFLKVSRAEGLAHTLFHDLRFDANGKPRPDFPMNDPSRKGASILIGRRNFGVGSSREAAVYALVDAGFRCVVATSFGDIFAGNSVNNGLVCAIVTEEDIEKLLSAVEQTRRAEVDLEAQTIK